MISKYDMFISFKCLECGYYSIPYYFLHILLVISLDNLLRAFRQGHNDFSYFSVQLAGALLGIVLEMLILCLFH